MSYDKWLSFCNSYKEMLEEIEEMLEEISAEGSASISISDTEIEEEKWSERVVFRFRLGTVYISDDAGELFESKIENAIVMIGETPVKAK